MKKNVDLLVVGGGISALSFVHFYEKQHPDDKILLVEAKPRLGGWIGKLKLPSGQIYETGPRALRLYSEEALATSDLISSLNLDDEIIHASKESGARFVVLNHKLVKLPSGFSDLFFTPLGRLLLKATLLEPFRKKGKALDESVSSFFLRRAPYPTVGLLADALVTGIWGGDSQKLSIRHAFPMLKQDEEKFGSCLLGRLSSLFQKKQKAHHKGICTLKKGLYSLIEALEKNIKAEVCLNTIVEGIQDVENGCLVQTSEGEVFAKRVVLATNESSVHSLYKNLSWKRPHPFPSASIVSISFGYKEDLLKNKGFGCLAPSSEDHKVLGIIYDSCLFPELTTSMKTRLTVMIGGTRWKEAVFASEDELFNLAQERVREWTGISSPPDETAILRAFDAIPQPPPFAFGPAPFFSSEDKKVFAIGSSIGGVSVNSCILNAQKLALELSKC